MQAQGRLGCEGNEGGVTEHRETARQEGSHRQGQNTISTKRPSAFLRPRLMMQTAALQSHHGPMALAGDWGREEGVWFPAAAPPLPIDIFQFRENGAARSLIQDGLLLCCCFFRYEKSQWWKAVFFSSRCGSLRTRQVRAL